MHIKHQVLEYTCALLIIICSSLHLLPQKDHARLLQHSLHLASVAHAHGYFVLDTFNMTAARYRHFLQGNCACHFHKVCVCVCVCVVILFPAWTEALAVGTADPYWQPIAC